MKTIKFFLNKVIVGDALEILKTIPDKSIDITVTSPPYNKRNKSHGWLVTKEKYSDYDDLLVEDKYQEWQIELLNELERVTKPGGSVFYNHKIRWDDGKLIHPFEWVSKSVWNMRQEIIWDRMIAANMRGWRFWQVDERIYWLNKPVEKYLIGKEIEAKHAKFSSIWRMKPEPRNENHPAPFPLGLPLRAIYSILERKGKVVLDPFAGTGTTLVAAKILGHNYIGIDVSRDYAQIARTRLRNYKKEIDLAEEEIKRHKIDDSFTDRKKRGTVSWPFGPNNNTKKGRQ
jgi:site-specific DNA-methyltransferase (adenine-specific)